MKNTKKIFFFKYTTYTLLLLLLYVMQSVPGLLSIYGDKPILVIPAAVTIAMLEGEFVGGIFGAIAGILCDMGGFSLFGFNGFVVCLCCIAAGLLSVHLMRCHLGNCLLFVTITLLLRGSLEYLFQYGMWGYENAWKIYVFDVLPVVAYSLAVTPLAYLLVRWLFRRFALALED